MLAVMGVGADVPLPLCWLLMGTGWISSARTRGERLRGVGAHGEGRRGWEGVRRRTGGVRQRQVKVRAAGGEEKLGVGR